MLIPIGFFGGAAPAGAYELVSTTLISTNTNSVSFNVTSLAATYRHLQVRLQSKVSTTNGQTFSVLARFNGDSATNYNTNVLTSTGNFVSSFQETSVANLTLATNFNDFNGSDNTFGAAIVDIFDFASSSKFKTIRSFNGIRSVNGIACNLHGGAWRNTAAITSIDIFASASLLMRSGSRISLYGIKG